MQTRHSYTDFGLRLPLRLTVWQMMIIWSSLLFSSPAWSMPKLTVTPVPQTPDRAIATQVSIAAHSPSFRPFVSRTDPPQATPQLTRLQAQRDQAAALLPLQPRQSELADSELVDRELADRELADRELADRELADRAAETVAFLPFSEPTMTRAIGKAEEAIGQNIGQTNSPPSSPGSPDDGKPPASVISDPELGVLRLQIPQATPTAPSAADLLEQGQRQPVTRCLSGAEPDPELGCLPLQPLPPSPPPRQPVVYLLGRVDYFRSSNVFSAVDPVNDGLIRPGLTLFAAPALGRNTYFIGSIDGNLIRYNTQSQIDYNELRFRAGIFQRLSPTMFGELGWSNQQLFIASDKIPGLPVGTRFLNDHAIRFELSRRDQLNKRLSLNTFYQLRLSFADPDSRSRLLNSFIASLNYEVQPNLQVGLDYQFALANFTAVERNDQYHQVAARLTYTAFRNTQLNVFVGCSFGRSTDPTIEFNSLILGVSLTVSLGLF